MCTCLISRYPERTTLGKRRRMSRCTSCATTPRVSARLKRNKEVRNSHGEVRYDTVAQPKSQRSFKEADLIFLFLLALYSIRPRRVFLKDAKTHNQHNQRTKNDATDQQANKHYTEGQSHSISDGQCSASGNASFCRVPPRRLLDVWVAHASKSRG